MLNLETIEELEERIKDQGNWSTEEAIGHDDTGYMSLYDHHSVYRGFITHGKDAYMLIRIQNECKDLLEAAKYALEHGYEG